MQPLRSYPCFSKCPYTDSHIHQVDSVSQKTKNKQRKEKKEEHIKLVGKSSGGKKELKGGVWGVDLAKFYASCINMILRNPSYSFLYLCLFAIVVLLEMLKQFWNHWRNKKHHGEGISKLWHAELWRKNSYMKVPFSSLQVWLRYFLEASYPCLWIRGWRLVKEAWIEVLVFFQ